MTKKQLAQEWQDILELAAHNEGLSRWLAARHTAFLAGDRTDGYTSAIRQEYRLIMAGRFPEAA